MDGSTGVSPSSSAPVMDSEWPSIRYPPVRRCEASRLITVFCVGLSK